MLTAILRQGFSGGKVVLNSRQQAVRIKAAIAVFITLSSLLGAIAYGEIWPLIYTPSMQERIAMALKWDLLLALVLLISIVRVGAFRFVSDADMDGAGLTPGSPRIKVMQAQLQNTLEQTVLAVITHLAWAAAAPPAWRHAVPVAVVLFVLGRLLFFSGYEKGAEFRALGFGLTILPSTLMLLCLGVVILFSWLA